MVKQFTQKHNLTIMKTATREAYRLIMNPSNLLMQRRPKLDMRYTFSRQVLAEINRIKFNRNEVIKKRKARRLNKYTFSNVLHNPIVRDYFTNKSKLIAIAPDRLIFSGRNHWAKSESDFKILKILNRYYESN
jgi:hypothetical protein